VNYLQQFCDLLGVCEELEKRGISTQFLPLQRDDPSDPTTPIPAGLGSAATWVGQGLQARRALIATLRQGNRIAYALEWERLQDRDYGKLLLCSAGELALPSAVLLELLSQCARERGVWPAAVMGVPLLKGFNHRQPHRSSMSGQIAAGLEALGWAITPSLGERQKQAT
jgi:hypothetical protein